MPRTAVDKLPIQMHSGDTHAMEQEILICAPRQTKPGRPNTAQADLARSVSPTGSPSMRVAAAAPLMGVVSWPEVSAEADCERFHE